MVYQGSAGASGSNSVCSAATSIGGGRASGSVAGTALTGGSGGGG